LTEKERRLRELENKILLNSERLKIIKNRRSGYSLQERTEIVRRLEQDTRPSYFIEEKRGAILVKRRIAGFRNTRHFKSHVEAWLKKSGDRMIAMRMKVQGEAATGEELKELRKGKFWSKETMAGFLGVSESYLSRMESGRRPISGRILVRMDKLRESTA
jgi:DNA-binding transcriptional regulator YiaG